MIRQTILPFKVEMTRDLPARASQRQAGLIIAHAGLALLGEFAVGLGLLHSTDRYLPKLGSGAGYSPSEYTFPLILMLNGGGRSLEDIRQIRVDEGLREILPLKRIPSSDAFGDWLRSMGINGSLYDLEKVNQILLKRGMKPVESPSDLSLSAVSSRPNCSGPKGLQVERYNGIKGYTLI